jgi:hypothetical protein
VKYIEGALEIIAAVVAIAFGVGVLLGLGGRLTLAGMAWAQRRAKRADRPRERVPGPDGGIVEYRPAISQASTTWRN